MEHELLFFRGHLTCVPSGRGDLSKINILAEIFPWAEYTSYPKAINMPILEMRTLAVCKCTRRSAQGSTIAFSVHGGCESDDRGACCSYSTAPGIVPPDRSKHDAMS
ncbi:hypothetical protein VPH35_124442 [Triticum aestivum]